MSDEIRRTTDLWQARWFDSGEEARRFIARMGVKRPFGLVPEAVRIDQDNWAIGLFERIGHLQGFRRGYLEGPTFQKRRLGRP